MLEDTKPTEQPQTETAPPQPAETPPAEPVLSPQEQAFKWLAEAPPEEILRHSRLGGILGQRAQAAREQGRKEAAEEAERFARLRAQEELDKLAREDPAEFASRYLSNKEQQRIREEQRTVRDGVRKEFAEQIGKTFQNLTEFQQITPEEFGKLQEAVAGKTDEEALVAFNLAATDIVAERRASNRLKEWKEKELAKEREAVRTEEAAKLLKNGDRPDLRRGSQPAPFDPSKLSDAEFKKWYEANQLSRARG